MAGRVALKSKEVAYHVDKIERAKERAQTSFFVLLDAIKTARDDLGDAVFDKELAKKLSFSTSQLSKYIQIAECAPLLRRQKSLPPTLTTLYDLTRLRSNLIKGYGEKQGEERFATALKKVTMNTEANDIAPLIQRAKERAASQRKKERERGILALSGTEIAPQRPIRALTPWKTIVEGKQVYRTIYVSPPDKVLRWISDSGIFISDVAERYPIADLRSPSQSETVQGFVYCSGKHVDAGLKLLAASGFEYRDLFAPSSGAEGFDHLKNQKVLLRGERGMPASFSISRHIEAGDDAALLIARDLGSAPYLHVFSSEPVDGWICTNPDQN